MFQLMIFHSYQTMFIIRMTDINIAYYHNAHTELYNGLLGCISWFTSSISFHIIISAPAGYYL